MSNQEKSQMFLKFMSEDCQDGKKKTRSKQSKPSQGKDVTTLIPIKENFSPQIEQPLFTSVLVVEDHKKISEDKQTSVIRLGQS